MLKKLLEDQNQDIIKLNITLDRQFADTSLWNLMKSDTNTHFVEPNGELNKLPHREQVYWTNDALIQFFHTIEGHGNVYLNLFVNLKQDCLFENAQDFIQRFDSILLPKIHLIVENEMIGVYKLNLCMALFSPCELTLNNELHDYKCMEVFRGSSVEEFLNWGHCCLCNLNYETRSLKSGFLWFEGHLRRFLHFNKNLPLLLGELKKLIKSLTSTYPGPLSLSHTTCEIIHQRIRLSYSLRSLLSTFGNAVDSLERLENDASLVPLASLEKQKDYCQQDFMNHVDNVFDMLHSGSTDLNGSIVIIVSHNKYYNHGFLLKLLVHNIFIYDDYVANKDLIEAMPIKFAPIVLFPYHKNSKFVDTFNKINLETINLIVQKKCTIHQIAEMLMGVYLRIDSSPASSLDYSALRLNHVLYVFKTCHILVEACSKHVLYPSTGWMMPWPLYIYDRYRIYFNFEGFYIFLDCLTNSISDRNFETLKKTKHSILFWESLVTPLVSIKNVCVPLYVPVNQPKIFSILSAAHVWCPPNTFIPLIVDFTNMRNKILPADSCLLPASIEPLKMFLNAHVKFSNPLVRDMLYNDLTHTANIECKLLTKKTKLEDILNDLHFAPPFLKLSSKYFFAIFCFFCFLIFFFKK